MSALHLIIDGPLAELRLDNPSRANALTFEMLNQLEAHCARLDTDPAIKVILLTAQGDRVFCAGADINSWSKLPPGNFARSWVRDGHRIIDRLALISKPTIAVLDGPALGGGFELAMACDIRVMSPKATLGLPETAIGIVPGWSGTQRLRRLLPEPVIKEMVLFGRRLPAKRALELGLVAEVADDPLAVAKSIAKGVMANSSSAVEVAKYMIHAGAGENSAALIEALGGGMIAASDDKNEGVAAFVEKRKPSFGDS